MSFLAIILTLMILPFGGVFAAILPLFGYFVPVADLAVTGSDAFRQVFDRPGFLGALLITVSTTLLSTLLSVFSLILLIVIGYDRAFLHKLSGAFTSLFAIPHLTFAIGFAFLIAPSGLLLRWASPEITGFTRPPDWPIPGDSEGISLILGLMIKELPFLALIALSSLAQPGLRRQWLSARSLGYQRHLATLYVILPALYPRIRYAVFAVLAYAVSTVDMALLLGPSQPASYAVWLVELGTKADPADMPVVAAGTCVFLLVTLLCMCVWYGVEKLVRCLVRSPKFWFRSVLLDAGLSIIGKSWLGIQLVISGAILVVLLLWMGADRWRFPSSFPNGWSLQPVVDAFFVHTTPILNSMLLGCVSSLIALIVVMLVMELEEGFLHRQRLVNAVMILPLMLPQLAYLSGMNTLFLYSGADPGWGLLVLNHVIMVLPSVFLVVCGPWRAMDPRLVQLGKSLGFSALRILFRIRLPILTHSLLMAFAIGLTVSHAQYLATLYGAGGRVDTSITETMALAIGGDRRQASSLSLIVIAVPLAFLLLAKALGHWRLKRFAGLSGSGS